MTIGIDLRAIGQGKYSGVEEYALNLLSALFDIDSKNQYVLFSSGAAISERYENFSSEMRKKNPKARVVHRSISNRALNVLFKLANRPKIDELMGGADIVFEPNINLLPVSPRAKTVVTFHDLSFMRYKEFFSPRQIFWHNFINPGRLADKADFIIAVSESTKRDLMEIYGVPAEKIKVVYSGIAPASSISYQASRISEIRKKYHLPEKYILYLGTIEPRKNIVGLIKAFELFKKKYPPAADPPKAGKLVIAGSTGWLCEDIFGAARNSPVKNDIIFTGFVADEDKKYLYGESGLFVYPSFYEGFGFPPLEAMAAGVPAITSDCSSLPETAGDAALMVNPYNINQMAWAMKEVLENKNLREKMIVRGYKQAEKFSWAKCARETLEVFKETYGTKNQNL